jgi:hypothetical protein
MNNEENIHIKFIIIVKKKKEKREGAFRECMCGF